jgi:CRP/FNR family transcriptional regulator, cyclic AMP receptor protein
VNAVVKLPQSVARVMDMNPGLRELVDAGDLRSYQARNTLFVAGEQARGLYFILNGSVAVMGEISDKQYITHDFINAGEFVGEVGFFADENERFRSSTVKARKATDVVFITYERLEQVAKMHPEVTMVLAKQMAKRLIKTSRRIREMAFLDIQGRILEVLRDLARQPDAEKTPLGIKIKITRLEICTFVGSSRETAGRSVRNLVEEGLISTDGGRAIVVLGMA